MTTAQFDLYFAVRLAFLDRPNVRIRTEDGGHAVKVEIDERLQRLVFPDPIKKAAPYFWPKPLEDIPPFATIGPNPAIHFRGQATVDHLAVIDGASAYVAQEMRREYDRKWRVELT